MKLSPQSRIHRAPDTVWREIDGRAVIISLDDGRVRTVNPTGAEVWSRLDGRSVAEVLGELGELYPDVPSTDLEADLDAFVDDLVRRGIAHVETPA
jgi:hypothetical protein